MEESSQFCFRGRGDDKLKYTELVQNSPFNLMGSPVTGVDPMKKWPHARLRALLLDKYDASE